MQRLRDGRGGGGWIGQGIFFRSWYLWKRTRHTDRESERGGMEGPWGTLTTQVWKKMKQLFKQEQLAVIRKWAANRSTSHSTALLFIHSIVFNWSPSLPCISTNPWKFTFIKVLQLILWLLSHCFKWFDPLIKSELAKNNYDSLLSHTLSCHCSVSEWLNCSVVIM